MVTAGTRVPVQPPRVAGLGVPEALHLLRMYASVVAVRPLSVGNREFLLNLIAASRSVGDALDGAGTPALATLRGLLGRQTVENASHVAAEIVQVAEEAARDWARTRDEPLFIEGVPQLRGPYERITVVFGPGIGLGDEVTFRGLVAALARRWPRGHVSVFTLYPGLWRHFVPGTREVHYRARPLRPFADLSARSGQGPQLVVVADFELFEVSHKVMPRLRGRDVVEVALGRREVRLAAGDSPWTRWERFGDTDGNNYATVATVTRRLLGSEEDPWRPLRPLRPAEPGRAVRRLLLNPISSKPLPFGMDGWAKIIARARELLPAGCSLELVVYPGLHESTVGYAEGLCRLVRRAGTADARVLATTRGPVSATSALPTLIQELVRVDVCLTLDTFTAHLAPLFGVPTAVVAYFENHDFWVPAPWALYTLVDHSEDELPALLARMLARRPERSARELAAAAQRTAEVGVSRETVAELLPALARCLAALGSDFPHAAEGRSWLALWSRVGSALRREELPPPLLRAYVRDFRRSDFFRLAMTRHTERWG